MLPSQLAGFWINGPCCFRPRLGPTLPVLSIYSVPPSRIDGHVLEPAHQSVEPAMEADAMKNQSGGARRAVAFHAQLSNPAEGLHRHPPQLQPPQAAPPSAPGSSSRPRQLQSPQADLARSGPPCAEDSRGARVPMSQQHNRPGRSPRVQGVRHVEDEQPGGDLYRASKAPGQAKRRLIKRNPLQSFFKENDFRNGDSCAACAVVFTTGIAIGTRRVRKRCTIRVLRTSL